MKETEIQRLRRKIIKGLSLSSSLMMDEKIKAHTSIAIMHENHVKVFDADVYKRMKNDVSF